MSSISPARIEGKGEVIIIENPLFSSLDVEMIDVEISSPATSNKNSIALIWMDESMETFL